MSMRRHAELGMAYHAELLCAHENPYVHAALKATGSMPSCLHSLRLNAPRRHATL